MDITGIVIATIASLIGIISAILAIILKFISTQTQLSVQMLQVEKELVEIKALVCKQSDMYYDLDNRVLVLEQHKLHESSKKG